MNAAPSPSEADILQALRQVIDPELNCNLVDLGLIYDIRTESGVITVQMTLTTPGCPMHDSLVGGVEAALTNLPGTKAVNVNVVWEPPWNPEMLTPEGREHLGMTRE